MEFLGRIWFRKLDVFPRIFHHPICCFLPCARLDRMTLFAIIPGISITSSNIPKRGEKGPHGDLLFSRTSHVDLLMVAKEFPVYIFLHFPDRIIYQIFYLYLSHFTPWLFSPLPLEDVLVLNSSLVNYGVLHGYPDHKNPRYRKGHHFGGCAAVSERALTTFYLIFSL